MTTVPAIEREAFDTPGDVIARPHANCYWVIPGRLLAGEHPGAIVDAQGIARIDALLDTRVRHFVDLTAEHEGPAPYVPILRERAATRDVRVARRRFVVPDFGVPSSMLMRAAHAHNFVGHRHRRRGFGVRYVEGERHLLLGDHAQQDCRKAATEDVLAARHECHRARRRPADILNRP